MNTVKIKKTVIETAQAARITGLTATLEDGSSITVAGPVSVGDMYVVDQSGTPSIMSEPDFAAELVHE